MASLTYRHKTLLLTVSPNEHFKYIAIPLLYHCTSAININEPWHEISKNVVCEPVKGSDQPSHNAQTDQSLC